MSALSDIEKIEKQTKSLMTMNQTTYIRDPKNNTTPIGTSWTLEHQKRMFNTLMSMQDEIRWLKQKLKPLY